MITKSVELWLAPVHEVKTSFNKALEATKQQPYRFNTEILIALTYNGLFRHALGHVNLFRNYYYYYYIDISHVIIITIQVTFDE